MRVLPFVLLAACGLDPAPAPEGMDASKTASNAELQRYLLQTYAELQDTKKALAAVQAEVAELRTLRGIDYKTLVRGSARTAVLGNAFAGEANWAAIDAVPTEELEKPEGLAAAVQVARGGFVKTIGAGQVTEILQRTTRERDGQLVDLGLGTYVDVDSDGDGIPETVKLAASEDLVRFSDPAFEGAVVSYLEPTFAVLFGGGDECSGNNGFLTERQTQVLRDDLDTFREGVRLAFTELVSNPLFDEGSTEVNPLFDAANREALVQTAVGDRPERDTCRCLPPYKGVDCSESDL